MALLVAGRRIEDVEIYDDEPEARTVYSYTVSDSGLQPHAIAGPLMDPHVVASAAQQHADAVLCDQLLKRRNYSAFNGAELAAQLYKLRVPAVLCTAWENQMLDDIRPLRRWIPVLMRPDELTDETLVRAFETCITELDTDFTPSRRPWRTQVHVVDLEEDHGRMYVQVPAWSGELIRLGTKDVPVEVQAHLQQDYRCHARVNLGAESLDELYFVDWEASS
jgi:hypothetical protein